MGGFFVFLPLSAQSFRRGHSCLAFPEDGQLRTDVPLLKILKAVQC